MVMLHNGADHTTIAMHDAAALTHSPAYLAADAASFQRRPYLDHISPCKFPNRSLSAAFFFCWPLASELQGPPGHREPPDLKASPDRQDHPVRKVLLDQWDRKVRLERSERRALRARRALRVSAENRARPDL